MGYVPPEKLSMTLRADTSLASAQLTHLFVIFGMNALAVGGALVARHFPPPSDYQRYVRQLYGEPKHDWMPFLNNALLADLITLVVVVVWVAVR